MVELNGPIVMAGTGCRASTMLQWRDPLQAACKRFEITSSNAVACFLANIGVESRNLTALVEDLDYSAMGLASTWPSRYAVKPHAQPLVPNDLAKSLARKPVAIANNVYANRLGNGNASSGDGWTFRGRGPIQITGRDEMAKCGLAIGIDLVSNPDALAQPLAGALSAAWYFASAGCIAAADAGEFGLAVKRINGAFPNNANQGPLREARRKAALLAISDQLRKSVAAA